MGTSDEEGVSDWDGVFEGAFDGVDDREIDGPNDGANDGTGSKHPHGSDMKSGAKGQAQAGTKPASPLVSTSSQVNRPKNGRSTTTSGLVTRLVPPQTLHGVPAPLGEGAAGEGAAGEGASGAGS